MRKILLTLVVTVLTIWSSVGQNSSHDIKEGDVIYLSVNKNHSDFDILISAKGNNDSDNTKSVNSKANSANIYVKWMNPLRYKFTWRDSLMIDDRDALIKDFISGLSITSTGIKPANTAKVSALTKAITTPVNSLTESEISKIIDDKMNKRDSIAKGLISSNKTNSSFQDINLITWQIYVKDKNLLNSGNAVNTGFTALKSLKAFDEKFAKNSDAETTTLVDYKLKEIEKLKSGNYTEELLLYFRALASIDDDTKVHDATSVATKKIAEISANLIKVHDTVILAKNEINNFKDADTKELSLALINNFLDGVNKNIANTEKSIAKLKEIIDILNASVDKDNLSIKRGKETYYRIRTINFDDGKKVQTAVSVSEYEFNEMSYSFTKKSEITSHKLVFRKYDRFNVTISTGIFYSNTELKSYGVTTDGSGTIIENEVSRDNAVVAAFLNIDLRISRYFAPLIQLGLDPTKKYPYLLLGTGFAIPAANLAITGGPIWTWQQSLKALKVGDTVESTTDLENDIEYKFTAKPKGWYLGIQYNF